MLMGQPHVLTAEEGGPFEGAVAPHLVHYFSTNASKSTSLFIMCLWLPAAVPDSELVAFIATQWAPGLRVYLRVSCFPGAPASVFIYGFRVFLGLPASVSIYGFRDFLGLSALASV